MSFRPSALAVSFLAAAVFATSCSEEDLDPDDFTGTPIVLGEEVEDLTFEPDHIVKVNLTMDPADFDALRTQTRDFVSVLGGEDCRDQPFANPYTYFHAAITVDGESLPDVGIRKKGFIGSQSITKPGFRINLDEFIDGAELFGIDNMTLNNSVQDPAYIRQCLTYDRFRAAGVAAPRCNFADVTLNGDELGIYIHVEPVKRAFLRENFGSDDGDLYEGTVSDFINGWEDTFEAKNFDTDSALSPITEVSQALEAGGDTREVLEQYFEIDQLMSHLAMETITAHWDGYAGNRNNFYVYRDRTTEKFTFVPWGADGTMQAQNAGAAPFNKGVLAIRILGDAALSAELDARVRTLLDEVWNETEINAEIDRMVALLEEVGLEEPNYDAIENVRRFVDRRRAGLENTLPGSPGEVESAFCLLEQGRIEATFETTWGSTDTPNATLEGTVEVSAETTEGPVEFVQVGAIAGISGEGAPILAIVGVIDPATETIGIVWLNIQPDNIVVGEPIEIGAFGGGEANGVVLYKDNTIPDFIITGFLGEGTLTFDAFGTADGDPVSGTLNTGMLNWGEVEP